MAAWRAIEFLSPVFKVVKYCWIANVSYFTITVSYKSIMESIYSVVENRVLSKLETKVIFFPDDGLMCKYNLRPGGCRNNKCKFDHKDTSLGTMLKFLQSARKTLDICVFTISCHELADVVVQMHKRGVRVRVITDNEHMDYNCSQIETFRREGIDVRHDCSSFLMHHKFAIVDQSSLLNGSFNWTKQAITGNHENVLITNMMSVVQPYQNEFSRLWESYNPKYRIR